MKRSVVLAFLIVFASLFIGIMGYHYAENLPWIDALLNASMILGGMGPVDPLHSTVGKLFASFYALYSCFLVLGLITILMAPTMHRVLHRFHAERDRKNNIKQ
jgi:hypothetical protein